MTLDASHDDTAGRPAVGAASCQALLTGARVAHYRLDERLGAGGMGEVFRAWDLALDRPATVKVIRPGLDPTLTKRLLREVDACARLQHRAIATFFAIKSRPVRRGALRPRSRQRD